MSTSKAADFILRVWPKLLWVGFAAFFIWMWVEAIFDASDGDWAALIFPAVLAFLALPLIWADMRGSR